MDNSKIEEGPNNIRVICRMRPMNALEKSKGGETCVEYDENKILCKVVNTEKPYEFNFDRVFGPGVPQKDLFTIVACPVIESVMAGYNGTIFCYGQTSSGKTFTMEGPDDLTEESKGLIPRMMDRVFEMILNANEDLEFQIKVSFLEIYNEKIIDLLDTEKNNLQIKENKIRGIFVQDATEVYVTSPAEMSKTMKAGSANRTIAATRMNERSSRSHSMFYLQVFKKNLSTDTTTISKLYFVDLAGSEKISKTNVSGQQLEEAKNINKSLTCLGMVINALTSNGKEHVPYRDSKLTRILQESLGGNARTTLVINISMCSYNDKETLSTLRFGFRAKSIKNKPKKNEERSAKELMIQLEQAENKIKYQDEIIQTLQLQITQISSSNSHASEEPSTQKSARSERAAKESSASSKLLKQHIEMVKMREKIDQMTIQQADLEMDLRNKQIEIIALKEDKQDVIQLNKQKQIEIEELKEVILKEKCDKEKSEEDTKILVGKFMRVKSDWQYLMLSVDSNIPVAIKESIQKAIDQIEEVCNRYTVGIEQDAIINQEEQSERFSALIIADGLAKKEFRQILFTEEEDMPMQTQESEQIEDIDCEDKFGTQLNLGVEKDIENGVRSNQNLPKSKKIIEGEEQNSDILEFISKLKQDDYISSVHQELDELKIRNQQREQIIEEKLLSLQETIISQNNKIQVLTEQNKADQAKIEKQKEILEKAQQKFIQKLEKQRKGAESRQQQMEKIISSHFQIFGQLTKENQEQKLQNEKKLIEKNIKINELQEFKDDFKKNLKNKNPLHTITEQKQRINELLKERKDFYLENTRLRKENDELQEASKKVKATENFLRATLTKQMLADQQTNQDKTYDIKKSFRANPSIRGGGGDRFKFQRNNNMLFTQMLDELYDDIDHHPPNENKGFSGENNYTQNQDQVYDQNNNILKNSNYQGNNNVASPQNSNEVFQMFENKNFDQSNECSLTEGNEYSENGESNYSSGNCRIINTEEEESRPAAFNLHRSAKNFQLKIKSKTLQKEPIKETQVLQKEGAEAQQDEEEESKPNFFNRIKKLFQ